MSFLNIQNLRKQYGQDLVFDQIQLDIKEGELVTLLGPSGCGKSTLLRSIAGLTEVNGGNITLNGKDITQLPVQKRDIAMVFQNYALFPNMTVAQNVGFGLKMKKISAKEAKPRIQEVLEMVEMTPLAERYPHQLSGGQCQRVALARSLVVRPALLLLDEPLSALDARIRKHLREHIRTIQQKLNLTTIFVTHDQEEALVMSDRILLMEKGQIVQNCDAENLYLSPINTFAAGFIGNYNILSASQAQQLLGQNINNKIAIRPEAIALSEHQGDIKATIKARWLLGNVVRYHIQSTNGFILTVDILNRSRQNLYRVGSTVYLQISEDAIHQLAA